VKEDDRSVLPGKGSCTRIVAAPKHIEKFRVGNKIGVIIDLNRLRMIPDTVVGWIFGGTAGVADTSADNSRHLPKLGIRSPESPQCKGGGFDLSIRRSFLARGVGTRTEFRRSLVDRSADVLPQTGGEHQHHNENKQRFYRFTHNLFRNRGTPVRRPF